MVCSRPSAWETTSHGRLTLERLWTPTALSSQNLGLRLTSHVTSSGKPTWIAQNQAIIISPGCPPPWARSLPVAAHENLN